MTTTIEFAKYVQEEYGTLVGRTIKSVRPMTQGEMREFGWEEEPDPGVVFIFEGGGWFIPMRDDEGNSPGALAYEGRIG